MNEKTKPLFVNVDTVRNDLGVSRAKAYQVIKELNTELRSSRNSIPNLKRNILWLLSLQAR